MRSKIEEPIAEMVEQGLIDSSVQQSLTDQIVIRLLPKQESKLFTLICEQQGKEISTTELAETLGVAHVHNVAKQVNILKKKLPTWFKTRRDYSAKKNYVSFVKSE